jgi:hypothetical protein
MHENKVINLHVRTHCFATSPCLVISLSQGEMTHPFEFELGYLKNSTRTSFPLPNRTTTPIIPFCPPRVQYSPNIHKNIHLHGCLSDQASTSLTSNNSPQPYICSVALLLASILVYLLTYHFLLLLVMPALHVCFKKRISSYLVQQADKSSSN